MEYLRLGQITKARGLKGEVLVYSLTSFPKERFVKGNKFYLFNEKTNEHTEVTLKKFSPSGDYFYLMFEEITTIEEAELYRNCFVEMDKALAPLPENTYRVQDLKLCDVFDENDNKLGHVIDVLFYSPTPILKVELEDKKTFTVPFVFETFIKELSLENKKIVIHLMPGLIQS